MQIAPPPGIEAGSELPWGWILSQSAGLVVALLWVRSLLRELRRAKSELASSQRRNEQLSMHLLRSIESASLERSKLSDQRVWLLDSTMRSCVDSLSRVLSSALRLPSNSSERSEPEIE